MAIADAVAVKYGLKPEKLKAQVMAESSGNPKAVSYRNGKPIAFGIAQFTPGTGKSWGLKTKEDLFNPVKSLNAMGRLMSSYVKTYKQQGDSEALAYKKAHIAYNWGPGKVKKDGAIHKSNLETPQYLRKIEQLEKQFKQKPKTQLATAPTPGGD